MGMLQFLITKQLDAIFFSLVIYIVKKVFSLLVQEKLKETIDQ